MQISILQLTYMSILNFRSAEYTGGKNGGQNKLDKKTFIQNLKNAVKKSGLKNHEIASRMGINESQVSRWISGNATPSAIYLGALCRAIDIPSSIIYGETVKPTPLHGRGDGPSGDFSSNEELEEKYLALLEKSLENANSRIQELESQLMKVKKGNQA